MSTLHYEEAKLTVIPLLALGLVDIVPMPLPQPHLHKSFPPAARLRTQHPLSVAQDKVDLVRNCLCRLQVVAYDNHVRDPGEAGRPSRLAHAVLRRALE
jgi:hypothetical protein